MRSNIRLFFGFCLGFLLFGCESSDWKKCTFKVTAIQFEGLRENQAEWQVVVAATNPTSSNLKIEGLHLFATLEADTLATLNNTQPLSLKPHDTTFIPLHLELPPAVWNNALRKFQQEGKSTITVSGDAMVHTFFGVKKISNAFRKNYDVDLASLMGNMGGDLIRSLFFHQ